MLKFILGLLAGAVVVAGVAVAGLLALDGDDDGNGGSAVGTTTGSTGSGETADDVLQRAADASSLVRSFHFVLLHENGSTPLPLNLSLDSAEGDVVVPDRLSAEVDADAVGINVSVRIIGIEDRTWVTNPFTRDWQELEGTNIRDFANPAALVSDLLPEIRNAQLSDGGSVDGVATNRVTGVIDSAALQGGLGIAEPGREVEVQAWIGRDDDLPRRVRLIGPLSDADDADVVRQVELSRFDQPVTIMPPE